MCQSLAASLLRWSDRDTGHTHYRCFDLCERRGLSNVVHIIQGCRRDRRDDIQVFHSIHFVGCSVLYFYRSDHSDRDSGGKNRGQPFFSPMLSLPFVPWQGGGPLKAYEPHTQ